MGPDDWTKLRHEHAWRYFQLHAQQRLANFQFSVGLFAALFAAIAAGAQYELIPLTRACATAGAMTAVLFWLLDRRNRRLVKVAEVELEAVEAMFPKPYPGVLGSADKGSWFMGRQSALYLMFYAVNIGVFAALAIPSDIGETLNALWRAYGP